MAVLEKVEATLYGFQAESVSDTAGALGNIGAAASFGFISESITESIGIQELLGIKIGAFFAARTLVLAEIHMGSGTRYYAAKGVRHPTRFYVGRVRSFGSVRRTIPCPTGTAEVGDATIEIDDTDQFFRKLFAVEPPQGRVVVLKAGPEGGSESLFEPAYTGEILREGGVDFPPGAVRIKLRDRTLAFYEEEIPPLLTLANTGGGGSEGILGETEVSSPSIRENIRNEGGKFEERELFAPIIVGSVSAEGLTGEGAIKCVRISGTDYNICRHPIPTSTVVVRRRLSGEETFTTLSSGYSIVNETQTIDGTTYDFTHVRFDSEQDQAAEVRVDCEGLTDDNTSTGTVVRNMAEAIRIILQRFAGKAPTQLNLAAFATAQAALDAIDTGDPDVTGYKADGAITERMTWREAISRMSRSHLLHVFTDKRGLISVKITRDSDPNRTVLNDLRDIYLKSESQQLPNPLYNRINYQYNRLYSTNEWHNRETLDDAFAQSQVGNEIIESPDVNLHFVRSSFVADDVANQFASWTGLSSYRIQFSVPGHRNLPQLELADLFGVTHYGGIDASGTGYTNREFLLCDFTFDLDRKELRIGGVTRSVVTETIGALTGVPAVNARFGPFFLGDGVFYGIFRIDDDLTRLKAERSVDWGKCWADVDLANGPDFGQDIKSYDVEADRQTAGILHIAMQLADWSVYYAQFNMNTGEWEDSGTLAVSAPASNISGQYFVSITLSRTAQTKCIFYEGEADPDDGNTTVTRRRPKETRFIDGAWTTPQHVGGDFTGIGADGQLYGYQGARVMAGANDRLHFLYNRLPGDSTASTEDEFSRTIPDAAIGTFTNEVRWLEKGLSYQAAANGRNHGAWTYAAGSIYSPVKNTGGYVVKFQSADSLTDKPTYEAVSEQVILLEGSATTNSTESPAAAVVASAVDSTLIHWFGGQVGSLSDPGHAVYKALDTDLVATPAPSGTCTDTPSGAIECGMHQRVSWEVPFPAVTTGPQVLGATVFSVFGTEYAALFVYRGTGTNYFYFVLRKISGLPIPSTTDQDAADAEVAGNQCG